MYLYRVMKHKSVVLLVLLLSVAAAQVLLNPDGQVIFTIHSKADFTCFSLTADDIFSIQWLVNGTRIEELMNVQANISFDDVIGQLSLTDVPVEYNMTTIQCMATFRPGTTSSSTIATLILQGLLSAVGSLTSIVQYYATISLAWTAPFSLDIINVDPDITYCVDVVDSISMSKLHSQCGLIDTGFNYSLCNEEATCGDYNFTITPMNVVGNGTSATVQYSQALTVPRVSEQQLIPMSGMDGVYTYQMTLSSLVCESELIFEDVDTGNETRLGVSDLIISNNTIMFTTAQLNTNRHYNVSVSASNPSGSALSNTRISTHDIFNSSVEATEGNSVVITTSYFESSTASGVLYSFLFIDDDRSVDFNRSLYTVINKNTSLNTTLTSLPYSENYIVYCYDIEANYSLADGVGYPAFRNNFTLRNGTGSPLESTQSSDVSCSVSPKGLHVSVTCDCNMSVMCDYNITGYQVLLQHKSLNDIRRLLVGSGTCVPDSLVEFDVGSFGDYHVTVFPVCREQGILGSQVAFSRDLKVTGPVSQHELSISTSAPTEPSPTEPSPTELAPTEPAPSASMIAVTVVVTCIVIFTVVVVASIIVVILLLYWKKIRAKQPPQRAYNVYGVQQQARVSDSTMEDSAYASISDTRATILSPTTNSNSLETNGGQHYSDAKVLDSVHYAEAGTHHLSENSCFSEVQTPSHTPEDHYIQTSLTSPRHQSSAAVATAAAADVIDTTAVVYSDVGGSKNKYGQMYAHVFPKAKETFRISEDMHAVTYSSVKKTSPTEKKDDAEAKL